MLVGIYHLDQYALVHVPEQQFEVPHQDSQRVVFQMVIGRVLFRHNLRHNLQEVLFDIGVPPQVQILNRNLDLIIIRRQLHLGLNLMPDLLLLPGLCSLPILDYLRIVLRRLEKQIKQIR